MKIYIDKEEQNNINLNPHQILGKGAEGIVYNLKGSQKVVKIYHPPERNRQRAFKLNYLIENKPPLKHHDSIIFPEKLVYGEQGEFVGFIMPKVENTLDLTFLCNLHFSDKLTLDWQEKFSRNTQEGLFNRLRLCHNIAIALHRVYATQKYVIVDIKPENIRVRLDGKIFIIDMDSVEVVKDNQLLFYAEKLTPEYSPAEIKSLDAKKDIIPLTWDYFSMAVVFYKVMLGLHPFVGTCYEPYEEFTSIPQKISRGLFPMGINKRHFKVIPAPHQNFYNLPQNIQNLFIQCFDKGFRHPNQRPSTKTWIEEIRKVEKKDFKNIQQEIFKKHTPQEVKRSNKQNDQKQPNFQIKLFKDITRFTLAFLFFLFSIFIAVFVISVFQEQNTKPPETVLYIKSEWHAQELYKKYEKEYHFLEHDNHLLEYRLVVNDKDKYGMVDIKEEKVIIPCQYEDLTIFNENLARFQKDGLYGFINKKNEVIIPAKYLEAFSFYKGKSIVKKEDTYDTYDGTYVTKQEVFYIMISNIGKFIQKRYSLSKYQEVSEITPGYLRVRQNGRYGIIDYESNIILGNIYTSIHKVQKGKQIFVAVEEEDCWGLLNLKGEIMIPCRYTSLSKVKKAYKNVK